MELSDKSQEKLGINKSYLRNETKSKRKQEWIHVIDIALWEIEGEKSFKIKKNEERKRIQEKVTNTEAM